MFINIVGADFFMPEEIINKNQQKQEQREQQEKQEQREQEKRLEQQAGQQEKKQEEQQEQQAETTQPEAETKSKPKFKLTFKPKQKEQNQPTDKAGKSIYLTHYKLLLSLSLLILLSSIVYLSIFYAQHNSFMLKDVSLTGGSTITIATQLNSEVIENMLNANNIDATTRVVRDLYTGKQVAIIIETQQNADSIIEKLKQLGINQDDITVEFTGPALSQDFFKQLLKALAIAFVFMAIVVFIIFRAYMPSLAVVLAALTDLLACLAIIDALGMKIGSAGIAAFLMLLGYSVDTDIMLTTRVLKHKHMQFEKRIKAALKTGLTMTLTSLIAVFIAYLLVTSAMLKQIFAILSIGLAIDLASTWLGNASLLVIYAKKKQML